MDQYINKIVSAGCGFFNFIENDLHILILFLIEINKKNHVILITDWSVKKYEDVPLEDAEIEKMTKDGKLNFGLLPALEHDGKIIEQRYRTLTFVLLCRSHF